MKVVISAAGTGGHINPGIVIANKIKEKYRDAEIVFFGTNRGLEIDLVPRAGYKLKTIEAYGIQKEINFTNIKNLVKTYFSRKDVAEFFDEFKPDIVIGTGGYICGPVFSVALKRGIPTMLHESNAYPGRAVKMFSKKVDTILVGFEETKKLLKGAKRVVFTGTPTKIKKSSVSVSRKEEINKEFNIKENLPIVLIFGGSQGAKKINDATLELIKTAKNEKYQIIWATGPKQYDIIKEELNNEGININNIKNTKIVPYIYNMEELMNLSDLLVCRSGAMTITEVAIVGKPAIFIPLPSRGANRQEVNARVLEKLGAAKVILNDELNARILSEKIDEIIVDKDELIEMGRMANKIAPEDVENKILDEVINLVGENK